MGCVGSTGPLLEGPVDADDAIDAGAVTRGGGCPLPLPEKNFLENICSNLRWDLRTLSWGLHIANKKKNNFS